MHSFFVRQPIAFHEGMCHVHLYILVDNFIERSVRHPFYESQVLHQIFSATKQRSVFPDGLGPYLSGKVAEPAKEVGLNLLKAFHRSRFHTVEQATLYQCVRFLLALSVYAVNAIGEPIK